MRGPGVTEIWDLLGHKRLSETVTIEWLEPTVGLIRFLYSSPNPLPYRGVVDVHIVGSEYEFKGMVFRTSDDAPSLAEHKVVKGYLNSLGYQGMSRRLKNGTVVVKQYGNSAKTQTVEKQTMATRTFIVSGVLVNDETGKQEGKISMESNGRSLKEIRFLQDALVNDFGGTLKQVGDDLAAKEEAANQAAA